MKEEKPQLTINEEEISLIKSIFSENEELLKTMRALFFGEDLSATQKSLVKSTFSSKALMNIMKDRLCPELNNDLQIGQVSDVWYGTESMVFGQSRDTIEQAIGYKNEAIKMTKKALKLLEDPDGEKVDITYNPDLILSDPLQIKLLARNQYLRHINDQLLFLKMIADQKELTEDEKEKQRLANSAK